MSPAARGIAEGLVIRRMRRDGFLGDLTVSRVTQERRRGISVYVTTTLGSVSSQYRADITNFGISIHRREESSPED